jgi:hypothetical protein
VSVSERSLDAPKRSRKIRCRSDARSSGKFQLTANTLQDGTLVHFLNRSSAELTRAPQHISATDILGRERPRRTASGSPFRRAGGVLTPHPCCDPWAGALTGRHKPPLVLVELSDTTSFHSRDCGASATVMLAASEASLERAPPRGGGQPRLGLASPFSAPLLERIDDLEALKIVEARHVLGVEDLNASFHTRGENHRVEIARMPGEQPAGAYRAFVAGLQQAPALVRMGGDLECLHVFLKPGAARVLLGVSGRDVASQVVHLADINGAMCDELMERLSGAHTWLERFAAVDRVLLRRLRPVTMPDAMAWAWRRLAISDGRMAVHELARDIGFSRRHFGERFMSEFGIAPKAAARFFDSSMPAGCSCAPPVASPTSRWPAGSTTRLTWCASGMRWPAAHPGNGSSASSRFYKTMKSAEAMIDAYESSPASVWSSTVSVTRRSPSTSSASGAP